MNSYPVTEPMRQLTLQAMRQQGVTKADIAKAVGAGRAWVTKFFNGGLKTIKQRPLRTFEDLLGIKYFERSAEVERSPLANKIAALVDTDPAFAKLVVALVDALAEARGSASKGQ